MRIRPLGWRPVKKEPVRGSVPEPGAVVAFENREVYRILAVHEIAPVNWDGKDHERYEMIVAAHDPTQRWHQKGPPPRPEEWRERPRAVEARQIRFGREVGEIVHWTWRAWRSSIGIYQLPEHYAVCVQCGEPYPCTHITSQEQAKQEMEDLEPLLTRQPGCCWGCGDPITTKVRKMIAFDGENVDLPTAHTPVVFHLGRPKCREAAYSYERRWVAAAPDRRRPRLYCRGHITAHVDGFECSEGALCPGDEVPHSGYRDHRADCGQSGGVRCLRCVDARAREALDGLF